MPLIDEVSFSECFVTGPQGSKLFHSSDDFNPILRTGSTEGLGMEADDKGPAQGSGPLVPAHPPPQFLLPSRKTRQGI